MGPDAMYQLLRHLTSPIVAVTSERAGKRNGMILDSAVRASIVPTIPRLSAYVHKFNLSHDLIFETGRFVLHLLREDQLELVHLLGFVSGRTRDMPAGWRSDYEEHLAAAQRFAEARSRDIRPVVWKGLGG